MSVCDRHGNYAPNNFCIACNREPLEAEIRELRDLLFQRVQPMANALALQLKAKTEDDDLPMHEVLRRWGEVNEAINRARR